MMVGKPGKSGGARRGAGRPALVVRVGRQFTMRVGEDVWVVVTGPDGAKIESGTATIAAIERDVVLDKVDFDCAIRLELEDGRAITIFAEKHDAYSAIEAARKLLEQRD